jgi:hypothetical protein
MFPAIKSMMNAALKAIILKNKKRAELSSFSMNLTTHKYITQRNAIFFKIRKRKFAME